MCEYEWVYSGTDKKVIYLAIWVIINSICIFCRKKRWKEDLEACTDTCWKKLTSHMVAIR